MSNRFAKVIDFETGAQLLMLKDPDNSGITFTTVSGSRFRSSLHSFPTPEETLKYFETITYGGAYEVYFSLVGADNVVEIE